MAQRGWICLNFLACAAASWIMTAQTADASLVQVVRLSPSGWGWITVTGDLETPEKLIDPIVRIQESSPEDPFYTPFAPGGIAIGRWERENFGPIFADVLFSKNRSADPLESFNPSAWVSIPESSVTANSGGGDVLSGWNNTASSVSIFTGGISGDGPASGSGEIVGTAGGGVDIVLSGQVVPVSSVPLPDAEWLFITGLVGWLGLIHHRLLARMLGPLTFVVMVGLANSKRRWIG